MEGDGTDTVSTEAGRQAEIPRSYHSARKMLVLFSGILLSWEVVGIQVGPQLNWPAIGNSVRIENPSVIPSIVFLVILYFSVRFTLEVMALHERALDLGRAMWLDAGLTWGIAALSIGVFIVQRTSSFRVAGVLVGSTFLELIADFGVTVLLIAYVVAVAVQKRWSHGLRVVAVLLAPPFALAATPLVGAYDARVIAVGLVPVALAFALVALSIE